MRTRSDQLHPLECSKPDCPILYIPNLVLTLCIKTFWFLKLRTACVSLPMPALSDVILDETTYYSTLGLSSNANEAEIHKSYMMLARQLHPDKSKSEASAEQFKLISHAHSVLMDEAKRLKYDESLFSKGLHNYSPREDCHRCIPTDRKSATSSGKHESKTAQESAGKYHRPYEQQPYGFGTEGTKTSHTHPKVPIFQSFNLKNYQRSQRSPQPKEHEVHKRFDTPNIFSQEARDMKDRKSKDYNKSTEDESNATRRNGEQDDKNGHPTETEVHEGEEPFRAKIHKGNISDPFDASPKSPFENNRDRHYARKKHEARLQGKRSVSPVKVTPTSNSPDLSDTWDGLKDLLNKFENKKSKAAESMNNQTKKEVETDSHKHNGTSGKVRKANGQSLHLDDLGNSLPLNDKSFDMQGVSDILDDVPLIKRAKKDNCREISPEIEMISPAKQYHQQPHTRHPVYLPQPTETLHMPVNQPLPKLYRSDVIALDQYKVNSQVMDWEVPPMPNFQCNFLNKSEVAHCKQLVMEFNTRCNSLKHRLLMIMYDRLDADCKLDERLVKVENSANWISCKDFDFEVVNKLSELQNRQRIVAQSFASILKSMYAAEHS